MYDLGRQDRQRLAFWREELRRHLSKPVGEAHFSGFVTTAHLSPCQAEAMPKRAYAVGEPWGGMWEYGWFSADVTLPETCAGQRVVLLSGLGGEQCVYLNGQPIGAIDREHPYVTLARDAAPGKPLHLLIESYAGHGARLEDLGPCPPERPAIPEAPKAQCVIAPSRICVWNEDAYQLLMDVETLDRLLQVLPDRSLRAQRVAKALMDFTYTCDPELPAGEARDRSFRAARAVLRDALACHNGSTAPYMWLLGQSHIDLAWLWPMEETAHKTVRTFSTQLALMDEYPEYRFLLCQPAMLELLKARDPGLWAQVTQAARRGQMIPEGAFYVECDTQIPSGESLIRQLLWGKEWFRAHFGVDSQAAWLPDCFGFSGALPQILKGMGVPYLATQKLLRADPECERFPYQNFIWEGIDGSEVLALSFFKNNAPVDPVSFAQRWEKDRTQDTNIDTLLYPFGYGDGGGGPTRDMLESARRLADLEGVPRSGWGGLREFFEDMRQKGVHDRWVGELYLAWHRGTLTSQRRTKALIRRAQEALHDLELWLCLLPADARGPYLPKVCDLWRQLMLCQFHDIAPGTSIKRVHAWAEATLQAVCDEARGMEKALVQRLAAVGAAQDGLVIANPLPWARVFRLPDGRQVTVPASSIADAQALPAAPIPGGCTARVTDCGIHVKNPFLSFDVDAQGRIVNMTDLTLGVPLTAPGQVMNDWRLYQNVECVYDAWEMSRDWAHGRLDEPMTVSVALEEAAGTQVRIRIGRAFGHSAAVQLLTLRSDSRVITFDTTVDWHERHRLLKAHFESNIVCDEAVHEIQFGHVRRPCHRSHPFAADRYEVCNQRYSALCESNRGFALLNDGIYGLSTDRGEMALSLLRAPLVPDDTCDQGTHRFTYALMPFAGSLADSEVEKRGYELDQPCLVLPGRAARTVTGFSCEGGNVILETVKPAEDGDGVILRLYESQQTSARTTLCLPCAAEVTDCGMDERQAQPLGRGQAFALQLRAFEIRTLRVRPCE